MIRPWIASLAIATLLLFAPPASAQVYEHVADIGGFTFEQGGTLPSMKVGYATWGKLSNDRSNAILLLPPTSGTRHSYDELIGPGKPLDTNRYFIIAVDAIGGGTSSKPTDCLGTHFPAYSIRDMVAAQRRLVGEVLRIDHLYAVIGASMGSFQAVEWGVTHPSMMNRLILIAPAGRSDGHLASIVDAMEATMESVPHFDVSADRPAWSGAVHAAAAQFLPWLRSDAYLSRQGRAANQAEAKMLGDRWTRDWDPVSLIWRYRASAGHDVSRPYNNDMGAALGRVRASTLIIRISSDRTVPAYLTRELSGISNATTTTIQTDAGHAAILPAKGSRELQQLSSAITDHLERKPRDDEREAAAGGPHLSSYVRNGDTVMLSGQLAFNAEGKIEGDITQQTEVVLRRIEALLAETGLSLNDVGKTTVWLTNADDFKAFDAAYARIFGSHRPARATTVAALTAPGARIEIEATAWPGGGD